MPILLIALSALLALEPAPDPAPAPPPPSTTFGGGASPPADIAPRPNPEPGGDRPSLVAPGPSSADGPAEHEAELATAAAGVPVVDDADDGDRVDAERSHEPPAPAEQLVLQPAATNRRRHGVRPRGPRVWGPTMISAGLGANRTQVVFHLGGKYFFSPWVGAGLDLDDWVVLGGRGFNVFSTTPKLAFLAAPYRRITPYLEGGIGPAFFSRQIGVFGRWVGEAGILLAVRRRLSLGVGLRASGFVPRDRFDRSIICENRSLPCHILVSPRFSIGVRL